jgi:hypothetical protein
MMTSFLLVKGLRIAMMYQGVNVEGLEAYNQRRRPNNLIGTMLANPIAKRLGIQTMFPAISRLRHSAGLPCFDMNSPRF